MIEVIKIAQLADIPFGPKYVLVMNGMGNQTTFHVRGATFVINNGPSNIQRVADWADAVTKAQDFAAEEQIATVYLLE